MKIYRGLNYYEEKIPVNKNIVELFTQDKHVGFYINYFDSVLKKEDRTSFGANYGTRLPGDSRYLRGIETDDKVYEIDKKNKKINVHSKSPDSFLWILLDMDKIADNTVVIEGTLEEVLDEFKKAGYSIE